MVIHYTSISYFAEYPRRHLFTIILLVYCFFFVLFFNSFRIFLLFFFHFSGDHPCIYLLLDFLQCKQYYFCQKKFLPSFLNKNLMWLKVCCALFKVNKYSKSLSYRGSVQKLNNMGFTVLPKTSLLVSQTFLIKAFGQRLIIAPPA